MEQVGRKPVSEYRSVPYKRRNTIDYVQYTANVIASLFLSDYRQDVKISISRCGNNFSQLNTQEYGIIIHTIA